MKNKIKKLFKSIRFIHILLIILILVVFFGLFKREIQVWKIQHTPIVNRQVEKNVSCQINIDNPEWVAELNRIKNTCYIPEPENRTWTEEETQSVRDCLSHAEEKVTIIPKTIKSDSTCMEKVNEQWFFAFGRYWFKVSNRQIDPGGYFK